MIKKTLINFAMIQTVILAVSINVGYQLPIADGRLAAIGFVWFVVLMISLLPAIVVSTLFAFITKEASNG